jgi:hypothetical protein
MAYICLKYLEPYYNIVTVCLYLPRIWGRREEIWEMSLVPPNFEELSNPSGSHTSHRAKSWSYQYSSPTHSQIMTHVGISFSSSITSNGPETSTTTNIDDQASSSVSSSSTFYVQPVLTLILGLSLLSVIAHVGTTTCKERRWRATWRGNLRYGTHSYVHERLLTVYQILLPPSSQITALLESRELQRQTISHHYG